MIRYTIRRLLFGVLVLLAVTFAVFLLTGPVLHWRQNIDLARAYAGKNPSAPQIQAARELLGLDKPYYVQFGNEVRRLVLGPSQEEKDRLCPGSTDEECKKIVGHFGRSFQKTRAVDGLLMDRFGATFSLAIVAAVMWLTLGVGVGILSAVRARSVFDRSSTAIVLIGQSLPVYYIGLLALYFLSFKIQIFPLGGYVPFSPGNPWPWFSHLALPAAVLAFQFAAIYARMTRASVLGAMSEDYVRTARAKGAPERRVLIHHALRNALLPIVTIFGLDLGLLLGGAVLTEYTFGIPGIGRLTVESARSFDIPLISGVVLFAAFIIVIANILVDLLYAVIDPRIRLA
jgi:ABC-type dipeptide/oligopeptide/nickel transport system permease component